MKGLTICIPSRGRANLVFQAGMTVANMSPGTRDKLAIVVPAKEVKAYTQALRASDYGNSGIVITGTAKDGISAVRQQIIETCPTKLVLMLDDDMTFCTRISTSDWKLRPLEDYHEFDSMLAAMAGMFSVYKDVAHVGLSARQGNQHVSEEWAWDTRAMNVHMFSPTRLQQAKVKLGRVKVMEDFDITLQLLRAGWRNVVLYAFAWNQKSSNMAGGCSDYRDGDVQAAAAHKLAALHPGFVKVVTKEAKSSWKGMQTRTDVRIQWAKAYESSAHMRELKGAGK